MAFVKVDDGTGSLDLVVFPSTFSNTKTVWTENKPILIKGKVDHRDEDTTLIVEEVHTDDGEQNQDERLYVKVPKNVTEENLKKLKGLLIANPGNQKVTLRFEGTNREINLRFTINWNELLAKQINQVLSSDKDLS